MWSHTHKHAHKHSHTQACTHTQTDTSTYVRTHTELIVWDLLFLAHRPHFSLDVRTRSPEGLLFFAATRRGNSHLAVYMSKGRIRFSVGKQKEIFNREKYNDGKWHSVSERHIIAKPFQGIYPVNQSSVILLTLGSHVQVMFSLDKKKFRLVVDGIRAQDGQLTNDEVASLELLSPLYLGSAPESLHQYLKVKYIV